MNHFKKGGSRRAVYVQYTNPAAYPPLEHSSQILAEAGWQVLLLGVEMGDADFQFQPRENVVTRKMPAFRRGWTQKIHYLRFCCWIAFHTVRLKPDLIYASEHLSCPPVFFLSALLGIPVVYHEHDAVCAPPATLFMRLVLFFRRLLARRALICVVPNEGRLTRFISELRLDSAKAKCVWNCPSLREVGPVRQAHQDKALRLYYHGNLSPELLPLSLLEGMRLAGEAVSLVVVGYETVGARGYSKLFREQAEKMGLSPRVTLKGPLPRYRLWAEMDHRDVGISFMPMESRNSNLRMMVGASNKAFDYLARGLAVLVSDLPDWKEAYVDPGYGLACDPGSAESIGKVLSRLAGNSSEARGMGEKGRQRILSDWNYENRFRPVLEIMESVHAR